MNRLAALAACALIAGGPGIAESAETTGSRLCYVKDGAVMVAGLDGKGAVTVAKDAGISYPAISPDGQSVAYTKDRGEDDRLIVVRDIATKKETVLSGIPHDSSYAPVWSPDGKWLLFNNFDGKQWEAAVIGVDNKGFCRVTEKLKDKQDFASTGWWAADSKSVWAYDFKHAYHVDLEGNEIARRPIAEILGDAELSSGYSFSLSPDGKQLLFGGLKEVDDIEPPEGGPPILSFLLNMETGDRRRVSPKGWHAGTPVWLPSADGFVVGMYGKEPAGVYRIPLGEGKPELLVKGASDPSVSR